MDLHIYFSLSFIYIYSTNHIFLLLENAQAQISDIFSTDIGIEGYPIIPIEWISFPGGFQWVPTLPWPCLNHVDQSFCSDEFQMSFIKAVRQMYLVQRPICSKKWILLIFVICMFWDLSELAEGNCHIDVRPYSLATLPSPQPIFSHFPPNFAFCWFCSHL